MLPLRYGLRCLLDVYLFFLRYPSTIGCPPAHFSPSNVVAWIPVSTFPAPPGRDPPPEPPLALPPSQPASDDDELAAWVKRKSWIIAVALMNLFRVMLGGDRSGEGRENAAIRPLFSSSSTICRRRRTGAGRSGDDSLWGSLLKRDLHRLVFFCTAISNFAAEYKKDNPATYAPSRSAAILLRRSSSGPTAAHYYMICFLRSASTVMTQAASSLL